MLDNLFFSHQSTITYLSILDNLGGDIVRVFLLCGVSVVCYSLVNIFVARDRVLLDLSSFFPRLIFHADDIDFFMLLMGLYFTLMGVIYYVPL